MLSALAVSILYLGGYFFVVHQRRRNPFISWPIRRPLPMEAYYSVSKLKPVYQPLVRLDQKMFPKRWQCQPTPSEQYALALTNLDLVQLHKDALKTQPANPVPFDAAGSTNR